MPSTVIKPSVLHFIPCDDALPDPRSLHKINVYGITTRIHSGLATPFPFRPHTQKVLVFFRGGQGGWEFTIRVTHEETGKIATQSQTPHPVIFVGDPHEISAGIIRVDCVFDHEGVYWMELVLVDEVLARQPIRVLP